ncbi:MAG: tyrosine-type recombinase/integrase [Candidatus Latescibacterota bacterium]|nr:tyrosine-type recombinase/integrase [Candidatus Latescibacterota bacterium]
MHYFELYTEFLADKRLQGVTPSTLKHYNDTVNYFFSWCRQKEFDLDEIALLPRWGKIWLTSCTERGLRPYTVHTYGRGLRTFFNWLLQQGHLEAPLQFICPPAPNSHIIPLEQKHLKQIIQLFEADHSIRGLRNFSILRLFCETGMRKSEMAGITLSDVDIENCSIRIVGKGDKQRFCYFTDRTQIALKRYLQARSQRKPKHDQLWLSVGNQHNNKPFGGDGIRGLLQAIKKQINFKGKLSPHVLRHTFAIMYLENGGDAFSLQQALGHAHVSTTQNYVNYSRTRLKRTIQRYQPNV